MATPAATTRGAPSARVLERHQELRFEVRRGHGLAKEKALHFVTSNQKMAKPINPKRGVRTQLGLAPFLRASQVSCRFGTSAPRTAL
jgi:hypothetical protein